MRTLFLFIFTVFALNQAFSKTMLTEQGVVFIYSGSAQTVAVAGEFNGWDKTKDILTSNSKGEFTITKNLAPGEYAYKFVVDGEKWLKDTEAQKYVDDGVGGQNSVVIVKKIESAAPAESLPDVATILPAGGIKVSYKSPEAKSVAIAGSFNHWNPAANPLSDPEKDGEWEAVIYLDPGEYVYMFVIDGIQWRADGSAKKFKDDSFGGKNSVLVVE